MADNEETGLAGQNRDQLAEMLKRSDHDRYRVMFEGMLGGISDEESTPDSAEKRENFCSFCADMVQSILDDLVKRAGKKGDALAMKVFDFKVIESSQGSTQKQVQSGTRSIGISSEILNTAFNDFNIPEFRPDGVAKLRFIIAHELYHNYHNVLYPNTYNKTQNHQIQVSREEVQNHAITHGLSNEEVEVVSAERVKNYVFDQGEFAADLYAIKNLMQVAKATVLPQQVTPQGFLDEEYLLESFQEAYRAVAKQELDFVLLARQEVGRLTDPTYKVLLELDRGLDPSHHEASFFLRQLMTGFLQGRSYSLQDLTHIHEMIRQKAA